MRHSPSFIAPMPRSWITLRRFWRSALIGCICMALLALAVKALWPKPLDTLRPGQTAAWQTAQALMRLDGVVLASGAYAPETGLLIYTRVQEPDPVAVRVWATTQLQLLAHNFSELPDNPNLTWIIDYGNATVAQEMIQVPSQRVADPTLYRYLSSNPALLSSEVAAALPTLTPPLEPPPVAATEPVVAATPPTAEPVTQPATAPAQIEPVSLGQQVSDAFDQPNPAWRAVSGQWDVAAGVYRQQDATGYDYMALLDTAPRETYSFAARVRIADGEMGGWLLYNIPTPGSRAGAQIIDLLHTDNFVRFGHYDANGDYVYDGGVPADPPINDRDWHTLRVDTSGAQATVWVDDAQIGTINNRSQSGYVGLTASRAAMEFDDVTVRALETDAAPQGDFNLAGAVPSPPAQPASVRSGFDDGNLADWQVLAGTWQVIDGTYQQTNPLNADAGSISVFQGAAYTVTARLQSQNGPMGGGFLFNMPRRESKNQGQLVNYTADGATLQWGRFDAGGNFVFEGSAQVPPGNDGAWHTLSIGVRQAWLPLCWTTR